MKIKLKIQLLILPMIIIPVAAATYIFVTNTSLSIRALHTENMVRTLEIIMNHLEQENSIVERLGASSAEFYQRSAQSHSRNFIMDLKLAEGSIQIFDARKGTVTSDANVFKDEFYSQMHAEAIRSGRYDTPGQLREKENEGTYEVFYQYFEPWDWLVIIYLDESVIYGSINKSISQILFAMIPLFFALAALSHYVISKITSPVDDIMVAVKAFGEGDYDRHVKISTNDEFKAFATAFNRMSDQIRKNFTELNQLAGELRIVNSDLEARVESRTRELKASNDELERSLEQLRYAQDDLVESRKLAALGTLVKGISHELNTPIGVSITTASFIAMQTENLIGQFQKGSLRRSQFEAELNSIGSSAQMILDSLNRTSNMISSFKLIAVDQDRERKQHFELTESIEKLVQGVNVLVRKGSHEIRLVHGNEAVIEMISYPGAISQVITHFIMNSLEHGFSDMDGGLIHISLSRDGDTVLIEYSDNGHGLRDDQVKRIFEPFYTSKMGKGTSGLGLNMVYNLVTGILKGRISATSSEGEGLHIKVSLPAEIKDV